MMGDRSTLCCWFELPPTAGQQSSSVSTHSAPGVELDEVEMMGDRHNNNDNDKRRGDWGGPSELRPAPGTWHLRQHLEPLLSHPTFAGTTANCAAKSLLRLLRLVILLLLTYCYYYYYYLLLLLLTTSGGWVGVVTGYTYVPMATPGGFTTTTTFTDFTAFTYLPTYLPGYYLRPTTYDLRPTTTTTTTTTTTAGFLALFRDCYVGPPCRAAALRGAPAVLC